MIYAIIALYAIPMLITFLLGVMLYRIGHPDARVLGVGFMIISVIPVVNLRGVREIYVAIRDKDEVL